MEDKIMSKSELKRISKTNQSEFSHKYACWPNNHNGWAKMKKQNRKLAKTRLKHRFITDLRNMGE